MPGRELFMALPPSQCSYDPGVGVKFGDMRWVLLFLFYAGCHTIHAQELVKKRVVSEDGVPLAFSTVMLVPGNKGVISNEDGFFVLRMDDLALADSLIVSHLGFEDAIILASDLPDLSSVVLPTSVNELQQVTIVGDIEKRWARMIFDAFQKRRESTLGKNATGRITIRSYENETPVEVLEGEAAIEIDHSGIPDRIDYTHLATNLDTANQPDFFSLHTAFLIENFNPFERSEVSPWPLHPGRLGKRSIYRDFEISLLNYNLEKGISEFRLTSKSPEFLSCEIWIREEDNEILHYRVYGNTGKKIPVMSLVEEKRLEDFSADLEFDFMTPTGSLNYLTWNYQFLYDGSMQMNCRVNLYIRDFQTVKPVFIHDLRYHDYAMAAILPPIRSELQKEFELNRSKKDLEALGSLQGEGFRLATRLIFWDPDKPFDTSRIRSKLVDRNGWYEKARASDFGLLSQRFNLHFNSIIFQVQEGKLEQSTFFDQVNSSSIVIDRPEIELLVNLLFDEYAYTAKRIIAESKTKDISEVRKSLKRELELNKEELLMNSQGGNNLEFLLNKNHENYRLYGIDRFYQLNQRAFKSPLFNGFNKNLNPSLPEELALALLIVGDDISSLRILRTIFNDNGKATYLRALNYLFKNECEEYRALLKKAIEEGFQVPPEALKLCL
jgi:hypothetical protein